MVRTVQLAVYTGMVVLLSMTAIVHAESLHLRAQDNEENIIEHSIDGLVLDDHETIAHVHTSEPLGGAFNLHGGTINLYRCDNKFLIRISNSRRERAMAI